MQENVKICFISNSNLQPRPFSVPSDMIAHVDSQQDLLSPFSSENFISFSAKDKVSNFKDYFYDVGL